MKNTEAYKVAIEAIEESPDIKQKTGGIKSYGFFVDGSVDRSSNDKLTEVNIKVKGHQNDVKVFVKLRKPARGNWVVIEMEK